MRTLLRGILGVAAMVTVSFAVAGTAEAKDFVADYTVDYTLRPDEGVTHVRQRIALTNQLPNVRASSYSLTLDKGGYRNLTASDARGNLAFTEAVNDEGAPTLTFTFNDRVVGKGSRLSWTIEYDSPTIARKHGLLWDVAVPRVKEHPSYDIGAYVANVVIPESVGKAAYVTPSPVSESTANGAHTYVFNRDHITGSGIVAAFGNEQLFDVTLTYHLHNTNLGSVGMEIALPPDVVNYQQLIYKRLSPEPQSLRTDVDGNTIAKYTLQPQQKLDITLQAWARHLPRTIDAANPQTAAAIPADLVRTYTRSQKYWEVNDAAIAAKADELTDPAKPVVANARAIYDYVTTTLDYNTARINKDLKRLGARAALKDPDNAVCMEYADLYIALARAAGIPAREVDGYAYTSDSANQPIFYPGLGSDILHAWVEVYLPGQGWVWIDPTWGSTTNGVDFFNRIDLNRIAFAIRGESSERPLAAGSYKTSAEQDGDVKVSFATEPQTGTTILDVTTDTTGIVSGIGSTVPVRLRNTGTTAAYSVKVISRAEAPLRLTRDEPVMFERILPGETVTVSLPVQTQGWLDAAEGTLSLDVSGMTYGGEPLTLTKEISLSVAPFFSAVLGPIALLLIAIMVLTGGAWFAMHRMYHRNDEEDGGASLDAKPSLKTT